jgi:hypothetical protein
VDSHLPLLYSLGKAVVVAAAATEQEDGLVVEGGRLKVIAQGSWQLLSLGSAEAWNSMSRAEVTATVRGSSLEYCFWSWKNLEMIWIEANDRFLRMATQCREMSV